MKQFQIFLLLFLLISCSKEGDTEEFFRITTAVSPENAGTVTLSRARAPFGELVEVTAAPAEGWKFISWTGDYSGSENPLEIEVQKDMNLTALFERSAETITIFTINDPHGKINNFAKVKAIIDAEKENESQVFFVSGGDIFSGNPIVDYHPQKGFPIIDLMNKSGMDVSALGNHEFDYGQEILNKRMEQANFPFLCANVENQSGELNLPQGHASIEKDGFEIAFISVVETNSNHKPSTHPRKVEGLEFVEGVSAFSDYGHDETVKDADLVVALTHYGSYGDRRILEQHDFVDLVIGGHNHALYSENVGGRYMVQSGADLKYLTKLELTVEDGKIKEYRREVIELDEPLDEDEEMKQLITEYNNQPQFFVELGTSLEDHSSYETGCFYTDALRTITGADIVFQNYGGIRAGLDYGTITPFDIYTIDPFGNGLDTFSMTVGEIQDFLNESYSNALAYSGLRITRSGGRIIIYGPSGQALADNEVVVVGLSDYISNVYDDFFDAPLKTYEKTTAEYLIEYLEQHQSVIDYEGCYNSI